MTNYSFSKAEHDRLIIEKLPDFTEEEMENNIQDLATFIFEKGEASYLMLLSNDINYYTIFKKDIAPEGINKRKEYSMRIAENIMNFILKDDFLKTLGGMKVFKRTDNGDIEIWLGSTYFLLFKADSFFVEV